MILSPLQIREVIDKLDRMAESQELKAIALRRIKPTTAAAQMKQIAGIIASKKAALFREQIRELTALLSPLNQEA